MYPWTKRFVGSSIVRSNVSVEKTGPASFPVVGANNVIEFHVVAHMVEKIDLKIGDCEEVVLHRLRLEYKVDKSLLESSIICRRSNRPLLILMQRASDSSRPSMNSAASAAQSKLSRSGHTIFLSTPSRSSARCPAEYLIRKPGNICI